MLKKKYCVVPYISMSRSPDQVCCFMDNPGMWPSQFSRREKVKLFHVFLFKVSRASVLFVDNPVGTGYSYVTNPSAYTTDVAMIAKDLLTTMKEFLKEVPEFKVTFPTLPCNNTGLTFNCLDIHRANSIYATCWKYMYMYIISCLELGGGGGGCCFSVFLSRKS